MDGGTGMGMPPGGGGGMPGMPGGMNMGKFSKVKVVLHYIWITLTMPYNNRHIFRWWNAGWYGHG